MGATISHAIREGILQAMEMRYHEAEKPRTLKISSKGIPDFNGNQESWTKWKQSALNTFIAAGYKEVLETFEYAVRNQVDNEIVYTLLATATIDGNARHVVARFDDIKDGFLAWQALTVLYDGESRLLSTAKRLRAKLTMTCLCTTGSSDRYIDVFLSTYRDLQSHDGHMTEAEATGLFLDNIHDPDYNAWKTAIKIHQNLSLDNHVLQFRERSDDINSTRTNKKRLTQHIRRLSSTRRRGSGYDSDDSTQPLAKRVRCQQQLGTRPRRTEKLDIELTPEGLITMSKHKWFDVLDKAERDFVTAYNAKVKHNEPVTDVGSVPAKLNLIKARRLPPPLPNPTDREDKHMPTDVEAPSTDDDDEALPVPAGQKRIRFNIPRVQPRANSNK